jgi:hypothetical protein
MKPNDQRWLSLLLALLALACAPGRAQTSGQLAPGASKSFEWSLVTTVTSGEQRRSSSTLEGRLNVRLLPNTVRPTLAVQLSPLRASVDGRAHPAMANQYSKPFLIALDPRGHLGESWFSADTATGDRQALDALMRSLQIVVSDQQEPTWHSRESDQTGDFAARYRMDRDGVIHKSRLRYTSFRQRQLRVDVIASTIRAMLDPSDLWLQWLEGSEQLDVVRDGNEAVARVDARFSLKRLAMRPPQTLALWREDLLRVCTVGRDIASPGAHSVWDQGTIEAARARFLQERTNLSDVIRLLARGEESALQQLTSYLRAFPAAAREVPRHLDAVADPKRATLIHALELAATAQAQQVLVEIAADGARAPLNRLRALAAMSGIQAPDAEALSALAASIAAQLGAPGRESIRSTATLTLARLATRASPAVAEMVRRALGEELRRATDPDRQALVLHALATAQASLPASGTAAYLTSNVEGVRAGAVALIAAQRNRAATDALLKLSRRNDDVVVRDAALEALLTQPPSEEANAAIAATLSDDQVEDGELRVQLVSYLGRRLNLQPENRTVLTRQLKRDADRHVLITILNTPGW